ncbi:response regulator transcription factor [Bartonella sp. HY038]|uniref:response regulator transcription factor n=1 Tax=Bartonella sp. HY038 TaxID=2759660 RepID=UPI0015FA7BED|nr:response regulator transcription factor [Bartonella sp. HY038]
MRLLVVEDVSDIAIAVQKHFQLSGHAVDLAYNGNIAWDYLCVQTYDLVILDVNLPELNGFELLKRLRSQGNSTPVLMLTARSAIGDRVSALDLGADDYLVKPFDYLELEARARALLRRAKGQSQNLVRFGALAIDTVGRIATIDDIPLELTSRELTILEILAIRNGRFISKEELLEHMFGFDRTPQINAIEQFIRRLRLKLADSCIEIKTTRGLGYQLAHIQAL